MDNNRDIIGDFSEEIKSYAELKSEDIKLATIEKTALLSSFLGSSLIIFLLGSLFFITGAMALVFWFGKILNNYALGMAIVSLIFLVFLGIYVLFFSNSFKKYFTNKIISLLAN
jgi:hypothetical protein